MDEQFWEHNIENNLEKFSEFIGILLGDGSLSYYKTKNKEKIKEYYRLKITLDSRETDYSEHIKNLFSTLFNIDLIDKTRKNENTRDLFCFKRNLIRFLVKKYGLVYSPKWLRAKVPDGCISHMSHVIKGYFDTDGCVVKTKNNGKDYFRLEMKISPSPMQNQFVDFFNNSNFNARIVKLDRGKIKLQLNGKIQLEKWLCQIGFNNTRHLKKVIR